METAKKSRWRSVEGVSVIVSVVTLVFGAAAWLYPRGAPAPESSPSAPATAMPADQLLRTPWLGLEFWQGEQRLPIFEAAPVDEGDYQREVVRVAITPAPLEIRLLESLEGATVDICAWTDRSVFAFRAGLGGAEAAALCIAPGKGMAQTSAGSGELLVTNEGYNVYDERALAPVANGQQAVLVTRFGQPYWDQTSPRLAADTDLFLVVAMDLNHNAAIDNGEWEYVILER